jgi:hypothetical protein
MSLLGKRERVEEADDNVDLQSPKRHKASHDPSPLSPESSRRDSWVHLYSKIDQYVSQLQRVYSTTVEPSHSDLLFPVVCLDIPWLDEQPEVASAFTGLRKILSQVFIHYPKSFESPPLNNSGHHIYVQKQLEGVCTVIVDRLLSFSDRIIWVQIILDVRTHSLLNFDQNGFQY